MASKSISDEPIQINYGRGLTPTEELLAQLGERSFLRFWSHANPHVKKGRELSDLLVVCGEIVIVFSDKNVTYNSAIEARVAWPRWFREAIGRSHRQLVGADRNLFKLKRQIFKDEECSIPLGLAIPESYEARKFLIAVVSESKDLNAPLALSPIVKLDSSIHGTAHLSETAVPFVVGDVDPSNDFVHVMDVAGLRAVLTELDTVTDFAEYLAARADFIRGKPGNTADSEWSLLAKYMLSYDEQGEQLPIDVQSPGATHLTREEWDNDRFKSDMLTRREANTVSWVWDKLIERHTQTTERQSFLFTTDATIEGNERVVRHMALENRLRRRILGKKWLEACQIAEPGQVANIRTVPHSVENGTTYVFLTVDKFMDEPDAIYRGKRRSLLQEMMLASLIDVPDSLIVIGLASELGVAPTTLDRAFLDITEHDGSELRQDAQRAWDKKRRVFESPVTSEGDEWSIPVQRNGSTEDMAPERL